MKVILLSPVAHDGKNYDEGDTIDMKDVHAQSLIEAGAAERAGKKTKAEEKAEAEAAAKAAAELAVDHAKQFLASAATDEAKAAAELALADAEAALANLG